MTRVVINKVLRDKLLQVCSAEFVDERGTVLGAFFSNRPQADEPEIDRQILDAQPLSSRSGSVQQPTD